MPCRTYTAETWSAVWVSPGVFRLLPLAVNVSGVPGVRDWKGCRLRRRSVEEGARVEIAVLQEPPIEALQTVDISLSNHDPELGRVTGAVVNAVLKSGSNNFHGLQYTEFDQFRLTRGGVRGGEYFAGPAGDVSRRRAGECPGVVPGSAPAGEFSGREHYVPVRGAWGDRLHRQYRAVRLRQLHYRA